MRPIVRAVTVTSLAAAPVVAVSAMIHGAGRFEWSGFYPWVIAPYVVFLALFVLPLDQSRVRLYAGCAGAIGVLAFTSWLYIGAMWFSSSSTASLVFVFGPAWVLFGGLLVWALAWLALKKAPLKG
jgi:hypothetical protein